MVIVTVEALNTLALGKYRVSAYGNVSHEIQIQSWPHGRTIWWNKNCFTPEEYFSQVVDGGMGRYNGGVFYMTLTELQKD